MEETTSVKEDFLSLKNHLNIAAKIELQTNEKMYENRLHHLEKMLEEMRHREETFLHIAEETNILKDQVDSLRELSLNTLKCEKSAPPVTQSGASAVQDLNLSLNDELKYNAEALPISYDSPVGEQLPPWPSIAYDVKQTSSFPSSREISPEKQLPQTSSVLSTGNLKL